MDNRVFVTGSSGFIGSHLCRALEYRGITFFDSKADLLDRSALEIELRAFGPSVVVHLAAISHPKVCDSDPARAELVNVQGTRNLLDSLRAVGSDPRIIFSSTAQVYAASSGKEAILSESSAVAPINFYAETKLSGERLVRGYSDERESEVIVFRIFNHVHRTQPAQTFLSSIYKEMLDAADIDPTIQVGNLDLIRDIGAIGDLIRAFISAIELPQGALKRTEIMNICNGKPRLLRDLAGLLAQRVGKKISFEVDPSRIRKGEPESILGSHKLATEKLGWQPRIQSDLDLIDAFLGDIQYG